jgi:hypothetical protein
VTSSRTPGSVVNSCATPSILTEVQRVAERVAEAAIERLDLENPAVLVDLFVDDLRDLELHQTGSCSHFAFLWLLAVELDDERFLNWGVDLLALGKLQDLAREAIVVCLKPRRD